MDYLIQLNNVSKTFKNKRSLTKAVKNIDLNFPSKGLVVLCGESGCGKTTLLNCIGGLETFSGNITLDGIYYKKVVPSKTRKELVSYIFQDFFLDEESTVYENILKVMNKDLENVNQQIYESLFKVGIDKLVNRKVNTLSGGQKQRVAITRAIITKPKIILADEPTAHLDSENKTIIFDMLKLLSKDCLVILATHEKKYVEEYADRVIFLESGKVIDDKENKSKDVIDRRKDIKIDYLNPKQINNKGESVFKLFSNEISIKNFISYFLTSLALLVTVLFFNFAKTTDELDFMLHHRNEAHIHFKYGATNEDLENLEKNEKVEYIIPYNNLSTCEFLFDNILQQQVMTNSYSQLELFPFIDSKYSEEIISGRKIESCFECVVDEALINKLLDTNDERSNVYRKLGITSKENFLNLSIKISSGITVKICGISKYNSPCIYVDERISGSYGLSEHKEIPNPIISDLSLINNEELSDNEVFVERSIFGDNFIQAPTRYEFDGKGYDIKGFFESDIFKGVVVNEKIFNNLVKEKCQRNTSSFNVFLTDDSESLKIDGAEITFYYSLEKESKEYDNLSTNIQSTVFFLIGLTITYVSIYLQIKKKVLNQKYKMVSSLVFGSTKPKEFSKFVLYESFRYTILSVPIFLLLAFIAKTIFSYTGKLFYIFFISNTGIVIGLVILALIIFLTSLQSFKQILTRSIAQLKQDLEE